MGCLHGVAWCVHMYGTWCVHMHCIWCVDVYSQGICPHQFTGILFFTARVFHVTCYTFCALHMIYKHWVFHMYLPLVFMYKHWVFHMYLRLVFMRFIGCFYPHLMHCTWCVHLCSVWCSHIYSMWFAHRLSTVCGVFTSHVLCMGCSHDLPCVKCLHAQYIGILCVHMCSAWFVYMYSVFASCTVYDAFTYTVYGVFTWCTMYGVFACTFTYIVYSVFTCSVSCLHVKCVIYSHV